MIKVSASVSRMAVSIASLCTALACGSAQAQPAAAYDNTALEEITVVAQKRTENLQDVPIAISAFTSASLSEHQIGDVAELAKLSPNVSFDSGSFVGSSSVLAAFIRGIGQDEFAFNFDPGVGVYVDGVYLGRTVGANLNLFDVDHIEILKGPQGTLFGRNTIGGAINVVTQIPTDEFKFRGEVIGGSFDRHDFHGLVEGPIAANLGGSLAVAIDNRVGYMKRIPYDTSGYYADSSYFFPPVASSNTEGGIGDYTVRGKLKWDPTRDLDVVLSADYSQILTSNMPFSLLAAASPPGSLAALYNACISAPPATLNFIGLGQICGPRAIIGTALADGNRRLPWGPQYITGNPDTTYATGNTQENTKNYGLSATVAWSFSDTATLKSISAYRQLHYQAAVNTVGAPFEFDDLLDFINQHQTSEELQLIGKAFDDRLNYVFGGYYFEEYATTNDFVLLDDLLELRSPNWEDTKASALFTHLEYRITDQLGATLGVRYTRERKSMYIGQYDADSLSYKGAAGAGVPGCWPTITTACQTLLGFPDPNNPTAYAPPGTAHATFTNVSPNAGINYRIEPDVMAYVSYSQGYKSGGWVTRLTEPVSVDPEFGPEKASTYEAGLKSEWLDHRLRANLAAFTTKYQDIQVNVQKGVSPTIENAGDARISGFEAELTGVVTPDFTISSGFGYLHARYTSIAADAIDVTLNNKLEKVPELSFSLSPRYQIHLPNGSSVVLLVDNSYHSGLFNDAQNTEILHRPAVDDLGASLAYQAEKWKVTAGGTNILDERYLISGINEMAAAGFINGTYSRPAEWYVSMSVSF